MTASASRPLPARITFALFAVVLGLHFAGATTGWHHGMMPGNTFRQAQTAISTYFIQQEGHFSLAYPTPVLGKPWSIPMEFPLYHWTVIELNQLTGGPLIVSARTVSLGCFYLALPALWLLLGGLGVDSGRRWVVLTFVLACPVYIFYARAFLIESMVLMFSVWFLAACLLGLKSGHRGWLGVATVAGVLAALVKITTLVLFLAPLGLALLWQLRVALRGSAGERAAAWRRLRQAALVLTLPFLACAAWTLYSDALKARNPAADMLRSGSLRTFTFGHLADRFSGDYWTRWLDLSSHGVIHPGVFAALLLLALFGAARWRWFIVSGLALFALAPAVFPFLYAWHDYYYAPITSPTPVSSGWPWGSPPSACSTPASRAGSAVC